LFKFQGNPQLLKLNSSLHYYQFSQSKLSVKNNFSLSLTYSTVNFSFTARSHSISQEIPCPYWKPNVHYCTGNCLPLIPTYTLTKPVHLCLGLATSLVPSGFLSKVIKQEQMKHNSDCFSSKNQYLYQTQYPLIKGIQHYSCNNVIMYIKCCVPQSLYPYNSLNSYGTS
jgi:hypothetical protein